MNEDLEPLIGEEEPYQLNTDEDEGEKLKQNVPPVTTKDDVVGSPKKLTSRRLKQFIEDKNKLK